MNTRSTNSFSRLLLAPLWGAFVVCYLLTCAAAQAEERHVDRSGRKPAHSTVTVAYVGAATGNSVHGEISTGLAVRTDRGAVSRVEASAIEQNRSFVVQLAAYRSQLTAALRLRDLRERAPALFSHVDLRVEEAALDSSITVFRIRAGTFEDLPKARTFCILMDMMDEGCLVLQQ